MMKQLPGEVSLYAKSPEFNQDTIPENARGSHRTKPGTWAKISILEGRLLYRVLEPDTREYELSPENPGIVEPEVAHQVVPVGPVRFFIEFYS